MNYAWIADGILIVLLVIVVVLLGQISRNTWGISRMLSELIALLRERGPRS